MPEAYIRQCQRWCHVATVHRDKSFFCHCEACRVGNYTRGEMGPIPLDAKRRVVEQLLEGTPCQYGHVMHNNTAT